MEISVLFLMRGNPDYIRATYFNHLIKIEISSLTSVEVSTIGDTSFTRGGESNTEKYHTMSRLDAVAANKLNTCKQNHVRNK